VAAAGNGAGDALAHPTTSGGAAEGAGGGKRNKKKNKGGAAGTGGGGGGAGGDADGAEDSFDEDMALLDALAAQAGKCHGKGCSKSTTTTGATCAHCRLRFCYTHGLPEAHGCGDAARGAARKAWLGGGGAARVEGDGGKPAALQGWQRDAAAARLQKKLDAAAAARTQETRASGGAGKR
jgi:hypothetical protein